MLKGGPFGGMSSANPPKGATFEHTISHTKAYTEGAQLVASSASRQKGSGLTGGLSTAMADEWDAVADDYAQRVEPFTSLFCAPLLQAGAEALGVPLDGMHVLDVACGPGAPAAEACRRGAVVTVTDTSAEMVQLAVKRAELSISAFVADGRRLPLEHAGAFQLAVSNFGVVFFQPMEAGLEEMLRCLRPGGAVGFTAWGSPEETEAFQLIPRLARELFGASDGILAEAAPESRRISGSIGSLTDLLVSFGLEPRVSGPVTRELRCADALAFWDRFALASPGTRSLLAKLTQPQQDLLRDAVLSELSVRFGGGEVVLPASAYVAIGLVPSRIGAAHIGTAGFSGVCGHWAGPVFPPGANKAKGDAALDFYQEKFDAVEVNGTAHAMPLESTLASWGAHCAPGFLCGLKAVASFT